MFNEVLNEDCMTHIFSFLAPYDLLEAEKVCDLWKSRIQIFWKRFTVIDDDLLIKFKEARDRNTFENLLQRCGKYVTKFTHSRSIIPATYFLHTALYCKHLTHLHLDFYYFFKYRNNVVLNFAIEQKELTYFYLIDFFKVKVTTIAKLIQNNPNLKSLSLKSVRGSGSFLKLLPETIETMAIIDVVNLDSQYLIRGIQKCTKLKVLKLSMLDLHNDFLYELVRAAPTLRSLELAYLKIPLEPLKKFNHLEQLTLDRNLFMNNRILQVICKTFVHLERLHLTNGQRPRGVMTQNGLLHLAKLKKLRTLGLGHFTEITPEFVKDVLGLCCLETLKLNDCESFDDETALQVLHSCVQLMNFHIKNCDVTGSLFVSWKCGPERNLSVEEDFEDER